MKTPLPTLLSLLLPVVPLFAQAPETLLGKARAAEGRRDYLAAHSLYTAVLRRDPEHHEADLRRDELAELVAWQKGLAGRKAGAVDLVRLAALLLEVGREREERRCYRDALDLDPTCHTAHGRLALWHYTTGRGSMERVVAETLALLRTSPHRDRLVRARTDFELYGHLRTARQALIGPLGTVRNQPPAAAARYLAKALETVPIPAHRAWLRLHAGRLHRQGGDPVFSADLLRPLVDRPPGPLTQAAHLELARLAAMSGRVPDLFTHLEKAVATGSRACRQVEVLVRLLPKGVTLTGDQRATLDRLADPRRADAPWRARITAACKRAGREGKAVLLHFYGPYCPFVMALEETLAGPRLRTLLAKRFIHLRVDFGRHHRATTLDGDYGGVMRRHGVPCLYVLAPDGSTRHVIKCNDALMEPPRRAYDAALVEAALRETLPPARPGNGTGGR